MTPRSLLRTLSTAPAALAGALRDRVRRRAAASGPPLRTLPTRVGTARTGKSYLVTGGHGFLGSHVVEALLARGEDRITVFDLRASPLFAAEIAAGKVRFVQGDLLDPGPLGRACAGVDTVFHVAAAVNFWARLPFEYDEIHRVNVLGTEGVVAACLAAGVAQLVFTSSATVVVNHDVAERPCILADERAPYAEPPYLCHYIATKILAEQRVLAASGRTGASGAPLLTGAVRPGGLFGPRDTHISQQIRRQAPGIGTRTNTLDHIYIENVVHALFCVERHLVPGDPAAGQAYFVTQAEEMPGYYEFNTRFARHFGHEARLAPARVMSLLAELSEAVVSSSRGRLTPYLGPLAMLRPSVLTLARSTYTFSDARAAREIGYRAPYTLEEGMRLSHAYWKAVEGRGQEP